MISFAFPSSIDGSIAPFLKLVKRVSLVLGTPRSNACHPICVFFAKEGSHGAGFNVTMIGMQMEHDDPGQTGDVAERIAVIAIHGVGDHEPFEMARAVGNLLGNLTWPDGEPAYCAFGEHFIRIPVEPVVVPDSSFATPHSKGEKQDHVAEACSWGPFDAALHDRKSSGRATANKDLDYIFMEGQLAQFTHRDPNDCYNCLRLEGTRAEGGKTRTVHIYDMCWSDLSGVGKGAINILGELYQLLFHLTSIGVNNIKAARIELLNHPAKRWWQLFDLFQVGAASALAWPIALLNLILLSLSLPVVATALVSRLYDTHQGICGVSILGFDLLIAAFVGRRYTNWLMRCIAVLAFAFLVFYFELLQAPAFARWTVAINIFILGLGVSIVLARKYDERREGSSRAYLACWVVVAVGCLAYFWLRHPALTESDLPIQCFLKCCEVTLCILLSAWILFGMSALLAFIFGMIAVHQTEGPKPRSVFLTARLSLGLSTSLFLIVSMIFWAGFVSVAQQTFPAANDISGRVLYYTPALFTNQNYLLHQLATEALTQSGIIYLTCLLTAVIIAGVIGGWVFMPEVLTEYKSPEPKSAEDDSEVLGNFLNKSYAGVLPIAGNIIYVAILLFAPVIIFLWLGKGGLPSGLQGFSDQFAPALGTIVVGTGITVLTLGGRVAKLALGMRPVLRVALDVDNWLREHPRKSNPTARICARYVSLLRFIAGWRSPEKERYDALVIFAHSQGTVITADLLRFLKRAKRRHSLKRTHSFKDYDRGLASLEKLPIFLFTVGCPLQQLYGQRFPYLYKYVDGGTESGPAPEDLGVKYWLNAYRSGDYVGRHLWHPENPFQTLPAEHRTGWEPWTDGSHISGNGKRAEFCLGAGAHMHYWDDTAPAVAKALDCLIARHNKPAAPKVGLEAIESHSQRDSS